MPAAIPLVLAGVSAYAGAAGAAALVAGTVTAASIAGGLMVAGAAMTALGTISGNKTLTKWGGLVSLAGGVTNLAANFATASQNIATEAAAEGAAAEAAGSAGETAIGTPSGAGAEQLSQTAAPNVTAPAAEAAQSFPVSPGGEVATAPLSGPAAPASSGLIGSSMTEPVAPALESLAPTPSLDVAPTVPEPTPTAFKDMDFGANQSAAETQRLAAQSAAPAGGVPTGEMSLMDRVRDVGRGATSFMKDNKELVNAAGGLIQGGMKAYSDQAAMSDRFKLAEESDARQRARINASLKGLQMPTYKRPGA